MSEIGLAIIEDNDSIRNAMVNFMSQQKEDIRSVSDFSSVESFLWEDFERTIPNVLLLDIQLPKRSGLDGINDIMLKYPRINILIYTMFMDSNIIIQSITLGAVGYVLKQNSLSEILNAIKIVHSGGSYLTPSVARKVLYHFHPSSAVKNKVDLTQREEQVINGLAQAMSYQEIADDLHVSIDTVRTYVRKIYSKMHVKSKTQLLAKMHNYLGGIFH